MLSPLPIPTPLPAGHSDPRGVGLITGIPTGGRTPLPVQATSPQKPHSLFGALPRIDPCYGVDFPTSWPKPIAAMPAPAPASPLPTTNQPTAITSERAGYDQARLNPENLANEIAPLTKEKLATRETAAPDFNDEDLRAALGPMMEAAIRNTVYAREDGIDLYLEPMLRATLRRALAEYSPTQHPFQAPGFLDRIVWRLQALFTSRTFEDIIFEKTHRFQVEEVFLLDVHSLAMISFASNQPGRHASAKRVEATVQRLAIQLRDETGTVRTTFELPEHRIAVSRVGRFSVMVAIVRGKANELVLADLEFALKRIEEHFRDRFVPGGPPLLKDLQTFLEDCLLIQAPAHVN